MIGNSFYIDLMLTMVMVAVGLRSLVLSRDVGAKTAARWRNELRELEGSLRTLITEASNSSATLDRRLVRRREELETLLRRIDGQASKLEHHADEADEDGELFELHEELPNQSWFAEEAPKRAAKPAAAPAPTRRRASRDAFLDLSDEVEDRVELSTAVRRAPAKAKAPTATAPKRLPAPPQKGIHAEVEIQAAPAKKAKAKATKAATTQPRLPARTAKPETEIMSSPSIMDPTTYSVARRLLARGTELHIVARKLDIPLAEVRLLDKLMRSEGNGRATEEEISTGYRKTERVPAKKIVRPASADDEVINLDDVEIFRETTNI